MAEEHITDIINQAITEYRADHEAAFPARIQVSLEHKQDLQDISTYQWAGSQPIPLEYVKDMKKNTVRCIGPDVNQALDKRV